MRDLRRVVSDAMDEWLRCFVQVHLIRYDHEAGETTYLSKISKKQNDDSIDRIRRTNHIDYCHYRSSRCRCPFIFYLHV